MEGRPGGREDVGRGPEGEREFGGGREKQRERERQEGERQKEKGGRRGRHRGVEAGVEGKGGEGWKDGERKRRNRKPGEGDVWWCLQGLIDLKVSPTYPKSNRFQ